MDMDSAWIDGKFCQGLGPTLVSLNPTDDQVVWNGNAVTNAQCDAAIDAAKKAFDRWASLPTSERIAIVRRYGNILSEESEALATLISKETGKSLRDAEGEVRVSIAKIELSIDAFSERRFSVVLEDLKGRSEMTFRPLGVSLILGPFNFPLHLPGGQFIPALLAGNTIVFKPSELTPAVGISIASALHRAGVPPGVFNMVQGDHVVAKRAIDHPDIRAVFFTGSYRAGVAIHQQLSGRPEVMLALEMGGNNPIVVTENTDPENAAKVICASAFISSGQRCSCARRLIVTDNPNGHAVVDALVRRIPQLRTGLPHENPSPFVTPLIHRQAAMTMLQAQEELLNMGGVAIVSMRKDPRCEALVSPGLIDVTGIEKEIPDEEYFGPLLRLSWATDLEHAINLANQTKYGLAASLLGGTIDTFQKFRRKVSAGVVHWNRQTTGASGRMPFGGMGRSGNHRPAGFWMIDACNDPVASLISEEIHDEGFDRDQL